MKFHSFQENLPPHKTAQTKCLKCGVGWLAYHLYVYCLMGELGDLSYILFLCFLCFQDRLRQRPLDIHCCWFLSAVGYYIFISSYVIFFYWRLSYLFDKKLNSLFTSMCEIYYH
jgi:hypothetical protein